MLAAEVVQNMNFEPYREFIVKTQQYVELETVKEGAHGRDRHIVAGANAFDCKRFCDKRGRLTPEFAFILPNLVEHFDIRVISFVGADWDYPTINLIFAQLFNIDYAQKLHQKETLERVEFLNDELAPFRAQPNPNSLNALMIPFAALKVWKRTNASFIGGIELKDISSLAKVPKHSALFPGKNGNMASAAKPRGNEARNRREHNANRGKTGVDGGRPTGDDLVAFAESLVEERVDHVQKRPNSPESRPGFFDIGQTPKRNKPGGEVSASSGGVPSSNPIPTDGDVVALPSGLTPPPVSTFPDDGGVLKLSPVSRSVSEDIEDLQVRQYGGLPTLPLDPEYDNLVTETRTIFDI